MEGKSAGYQSNAGEKRKKHGEEGERENTIRETGISVKKWTKQKKDG
jgi:hypothetical protein